MSAKDVADTIIKDFRTSIADVATYRFRTSEEASAVYDELDEPDWLMTELAWHAHAQRDAPAVERELAIY